MIYPRRASRQRAQGIQAVSARSESGADSTQAPSSYMDSGVVSSPSAIDAAPASRVAAPPTARAVPPPLSKTSPSAEAPKSRALPPPLSKVAVPVAKLSVPASRKAPVSSGPSLASAPVQPSTNGVPSARLSAPESYALPSRLAPSSQAIEVLGNCELRAEIAKGGMARIYLGVQRGAEGFEKLVAVKKLLPELRDNPDYVAMLVDEARISAHARHPFVRDVFQVGTAPDGSPYLVMEFLMGEPLSKVARALSKPGKRATRDVCHIARLVAQMCEGLHAVHELTEDGRPLGLVHRDVTPQNLFLLHNGTVRVTDFGIVQGEGRRQQTRGKALKGKLAYMAPEYLARKPYDRRADVWALGVCLWELAVGRRLFRRENDVAMLGAILDERIPTPSASRDGIDMAFDEIVMKALDRDVTTRYQSAADLAADLEQYVAAKQEVVSARDLGKWLGALLPDSLPTLKRLTDSVKNAKLSDPAASSRTETPVSKTAPAVAPKRTEESVVAAKPSVTAAAAPAAEEAEDTEATMEVDLPGDEAPATPVSTYSAPVLEQVAPRSRLFSANEAVTKPTPVVITAVSEEAAPKSRHLRAPTAPFSLVRKRIEHERPTSPPPSTFKVSNAR